MSATKTELKRAFESGRMSSMLRVLPEIAFEQFYADFAEDRRLKREGLKKAKDERSKALIKEARRRSNIDVLGGKLRVDEDPTLSRGGVPIDENFWGNK